VVEVCCARNIAGTIRKVRKPVFTLNTPKGP